MPCGCQKGRKLPPQSGSSEIPGPSPSNVAARVAVYSVVKNGQTVLTTSSPSAARDESRRVGGSIKVSSRPVLPAEEMVSA